MVSLKNLEMMWPEMLGTRRAGSRVYLNTPCGRSRSVDKEDEVHFGKVVAKV